MEQKLVMFGHGGSYNHGCEAILRSTLGILDRMEGGCPPVALYSGDPASDREFALEAAGYPLELRPQRKPFRITNPMDDLAMALRKFLGQDALYLRRFFAGKMEGVRDSLCLSVGGDMYCYGHLSWLYYIHETLKQNGNRTVLWGCSVDPTSFQPGSKEDLARYDRIITRESISYALLRENGFENVKLCPDPAFTLPPQEVELPFAFDGGNTVALNLSPLMKRYQGGSLLRANAARLIRHILNDTPLQILLLPHVNGWTEQEDDHAYLKQLREEQIAGGADAARLHLLGRGYNCRELKQIISRCRFLVTARTHASIAAYSTGVPTLVLGYSPKARGIARDIFGDETHYVLPVQELESETQFAEAFDWLTAREADIRSHLRAVMPGYIEAAYAAGNEIADLLPQIGR